ncbi:MAG: tetratricopeptide repeat protein [Planctomycetes bacterium]|nr:tetratricopeptide repeat protein [Planctomycetota bacterium]
MAGNEEGRRQAGVSKSRLIAAALEVVGAVVLVVTVVLALTWLWVVSQLSPRPETGELAQGFMIALGLGLGGLVGGLLMMGLAEVVRQLAALHQTPQHTAGAASPRGEVGPSAADRAGSGPAEGKFAQPRELIALLREIRDISLLSEQQRAQRRDLQGQDLIRVLERNVPALLREHKWVEARHRVHEARERFPDFPQWRKLEEQIETLRANVESRDVETAVRQVKDLATIDAWGRAMDVVRDLLERHPQSPKANELARRTKLEREKAEAEQCARLMSKAQAATDRRDWIEALAAANQLVEEFPKSPEAEALREQLDVLTTNAEIQMRQQMEGNIRDLLREQDFGEALRIARELVQRYPNSPQAELLQDQLPRLEERAAAAGQTR